MTSRLASLLVQDGLVSAKKMAEAFQRQVIYGGTLDTILLEMDVIDEGMLLDALGRASALPTAGDLPSVAELQAAHVHEQMPYAMSERYRAVPALLDGNTLRVLVIDPPDRKQLDELGYTLSYTIEPIIVTEHRFVQAAELVYGVPVPARYASLAGKLRARSTDPNRVRLVVPTQPLLTPSAPVRDRRITPAPVIVVSGSVTPVPATSAPGASAAHANGPSSAASSLVASESASATPATAPAAASAAVTAEPEAAATPSPAADAVEAPAEPARAVVTDVPMPNAKPSTAPLAPLPDDPSQPISLRPAMAPIVPSERQANAPVEPQPSTPSAVSRPSGAPPESPPTALGADEARQAIDAAADRDAIFEALCRGARAHLPFAAVLTVHGETAAGRLALGQSWFDRPTLAAVAVGLEQPSPFRAAAVGRAPYLGRIGDDAAGTQLLASLGRKPPLPALLMPVVLRERAVALLYADADGDELSADAVAELSTLTAAAARSFQRLILKAKGGDYAKAAPGALGKLAHEEPAHADESAAPGWHKPSGEGSGRVTQPRFSMALVNAIKDELTVPGGARATIPAVQVPPREDGAPAADLHDQPTAPLPDVEQLCLSVERQDAHAQMSADTLVALAERAALAVVVRMPGPLRLDRHKLRGATPPLAEHGPLLAVLARLGRAARDPLLGRLKDPSLEVRYYATLALGELRVPELVKPLGTRLYDPDAAVRRAAVDALARFGDSPELRALVEQLRGELPGPDPIRQRFAAEALGVMRDALSVPRLIELVKHADAAVVAAAKKALVEITKQDFGTSRWRWRSWWERHRDEPRVEWMLEGLGHAEPEVRLSASEELRGLSEQYFGYAFDLPKREREDARRRWVEWWRENSAKTQDKR